VITVTVPEYQFRNALRGYAKDRKMELSEVMQQQARLLAVKLATVTLPKGLGVDAKATGERNVRADIHKLAITPEELLLKVRTQSSTWGQRFEAYVRAGRWDDVFNMMQNSPGLAFYALESSISQAQHGEAFRGGKISRHSVKYVVTNPESLKTLTEHLVARVGHAKGGWADVARRLGGTRGIPSWVTRHTGRGRATIRTMTDMPLIILTNEVHYIRDILKPADIEAAIFLQKKNMIAHMTHRSRTANGKI